MTQHRPPVPPFTAETADRWYHSRGNEPEEFDAVPVAASERTTFGPHRQEER